MTSMVKFMMIASYELRGGNFFVGFSHGEVLTPINPLLNTPLIWEALE